MQKVIESLEKGLLTGDFTIFAKRVSRGRFPEEINLEINIKRGQSETYLMQVKIFKGLRPSYKPWAELFGIKAVVDLAGKSFPYFGSNVEEHLLSLFSDPIEPGGKIFVEYYRDDETARGLNSGFPPPVTRLGYKLFERSFTWFKDWYFPEGFREGGQKLQGEKPLDARARKRQLDTIRMETQTFIKKQTETDRLEDYESRALERAKKVLRFAEAPLNVVSRPRKA